MASIRLVPLDPSDVSPRPISARLRSQLVYFSSGATGADLGPDEFQFAPADVARWLDDGVFYLVSPLDSAKVTEVELSEEQEELLTWLKGQSVRLRRRACGGVVSGLPGGGVFAMSDSTGRFWILAASTVVLGSFSYGGEFDRIEGDTLRAITRSADAKRRERLSMNDIEDLPAVLRDTRSAFLVVKTDRGNYTRMLVSQALRKPPGGSGEAIPVVVLDQFETFEPGKVSSRVAKGAGLLLFDGFQVDLDSGIVVPENQGGDLAFVAKTPAGQSINPVGSAAVFTVQKPLPAGPPRPGPSPGRAVIPSDFAGRYRLHADGRWSGLLELQVGDDRTVTGHFRSEPNGTAYEIKGEVAAETPQKLTFTVRFPRTEQEYEAYLWTEGKRAMAGTFKAQERTYGFFAVREGEKVGSGD